MKKFNAVKSFFVLSIFILGINSVKSQQKFGDNPQTINANSMVEVESTNKGILFPRMALSSTNATTPMSAHVNGMVIFNTATSGTAPNDVTPGFYYNDGTKWVRVAAASSSTGAQNTTSGQLITVTNGTGATFTAMVVGVDTTALKSFLNNKIQVSTTAPITGNGTIASPIGLTSNNTTGGSLVTITNGTGATLTAMVVAVNTTALRDTIAKYVTSNTNLRDSLTSLINTVIKDSTKVTGKNLTSTNSLITVTNGIGTTLRTTSVTLNTSALKDSTAKWVGQAPIKDSLDKNYWRLNGNTGTTSSNYIGTNDATNFQVKVNNILSATTTTIGNTKIGTKAVDFGDAALPKLMIFGDSAYKLNGLNGGGQWNAIALGIGMGQLTGNSPGVGGNSRPTIGVYGQNNTILSTFGGGYEGAYGTTFEVRTNISNSTTGGGSNTVDYAFVAKRVATTFDSNSTALPMIGTNSMYPLMGSMGLSFRPSATANPYAFIGTSGASNSNMGVGNVNPTNRLHVTASSNPLRLEGLVSGNTSDSILTADATGVVRRRSPSAIASSSEPWYSTVTNSGSTSNTDSIYILGKVGIGTKTPTDNLNVMDTSAGGVTLGLDGSQYPTFYGTSYNGYSGAHPTGHTMFGGRIANGTKANPTAITTQRTMSAFGAYFHNGTSFIEGARLNFSAYTPAGGQYPLAMTIWKNLPNGTGSAPLHIDSINRIGVNNLSPITTLDVGSDSFGKNQLWIREGSGGALGVAAGEGLKIEYSKSTNTGNLVAYNYADTTPRNISINAGGGGYVGIGTALPKERLHVAGKVKIDTLPAGSISDSIVTVDTLGVLRKRTVASVASASEPWFNTVTKTASTNNTDSIYIMGRVAIGFDSTPARAALEVRGATPFSASIQATSTTDLNHAFKLRNTFNNRAWKMYLLNSTDGTPHGYLLEYFNGTNYVRRMTIDSGGDLIYHSPGKRVHTSNFYSDSISKFNVNGTDSTAFSQIRLTQGAISGYLYTMGKAYPQDTTYQMFAPATVNLDAAPGAQLALSTQSAKPIRFYVDSRQTLLNDSLRNFFFGTKENTALSNTGFSLDNQYKVRIFPDTITSANNNLQSALGMMTRKPKTGLNRVMAIYEHYGTPYSLFAMANDSLNNIYLGGNNNKMFLTTNSTLWAKTQFALSGPNIGMGTENPTNKLHIIDASNPLRLEGLQYGAASDSVLTANSTGVVRKFSASAIAASSEPWFQVSTGTGATGNTQNIYHRGYVGINTINNTTNRLQVGNHTSTWGGHNLMLSNDSNVLIHNPIGFTPLYDGFWSNRNITFNWQSVKGGDIGGIGIGNLAPTNKLHVTATTDPLRLEGLQYGANTDSILTVNASGVVREISRSDISNVKNFVVTAVSYTATSANHTILFNGTTATLTLPSAASFANRELRIVNHGTGNVTLSTAVNTGNGLSTTTLGISSATNSMTIMSNGTNWYKVSN